MSRLCNYDLCGWDSSGRPLSNALIYKLDEILDRLGAEDCGSGITEGCPYITSFSTEAQGASDEVEQALLSFSQAHPDILLELEYVCLDEEIHSKTRYMNGMTETVDAVVSFPPFDTLHIPQPKGTGWILTDDSSLQLIRPLGERRFDCIDTGEKPNGLCFVCRRTIDLNDYDMDDAFIQQYLDPYGYENPDVLHKTYGDAADQIIAECILETELWEQQEIVYASTESACRAYILAVVGDQAER